MHRQLSKANQTGVSGVRLYAVFAVTLIVIVAGIGCSPRRVVLTFDNRTDAVLCQYTNPNSAAAARCLAEVEPRAETRWEQLCGGDASRPITVIIAVKQGGDQIYGRTVSCGAWLDTDRRIVIEQEGDEFIVTDGLMGSVRP